MSYIDYAKMEFRAAGWTDENGKFKEEYQELMCEQVLELLELFDKHGHSGSSAPYAIKLFSKLAKFKPIVPLTGEDWEWNEVSFDVGSGPLYQNKRCSSVFKDNDGVYDNNGKVFWEWNRRPLDEDEEGYPGFRTYKSYYGSKGCEVPVTFPYTVPDKPIYEYRYSDCTPPAPPQTEEGIL